MARISRDQMLMLIAHIAATRGTCNRLSVGAVLAFEARPVSLGYNGAPPGAHHCDSTCNQEKPCTNTVHAEANAISWARAFGIDPKGGTLYVTDSPCMACAGLIVEAGIKRVVYDREYRIINQVLRFFQDRKVEVVQCRVENALSVSYPNLQTTPASGE